jgi:hypothetical protein
MLLPRAVCGDGVVHCGFKFDLERIRDPLPFDEHLAHHPAYVIVHRRGDADEKTASRGEQLRGGRKRGGAQGDRGHHDGSSRRPVERMLQLRVESAGFKTLFRSQLRPPKPEGVA